MLITKKIIYACILSSLALVNLSILTSFNLFYLDAIFIFIFLFTVPGFISMLILKITHMEAGEYISYCVGISIAFLMIVGLLANWVAPLFGVDRPLSIVPLLTAFNVMFIALLGYLYYKLKLINIRLSKPKLTILNKILFFIPILMPILSVFGAITLNNHGPAYITLTLYGLIIAYVILLAIFRNKLNEKVYPWSLYFIALALVYTGSLRSWFISSTDATLEHGMGNFILTNGVWNYWSGDNNYFAMLSIVILPTALSILLKSSLLIVQKIAFPILFSFLAMVLFYLFNKVTNKTLAFLGTLFFLFHPTFAIWSLLPPRQEIAFLFLGLLFLTTFSDKFTNKVKYILFGIFSFGVITSHYTTTYIVSLILVLSIIVIVCADQFAKFRSRNVPAENKKSRKSYLTIALVAIFLVTELVWYFGVTNIGYKGRNVAESKLAKNAFSIDKSPLNIFTRRTSYDPYQDLNKYVKNIKDKKLTSYADSEINKYPQYLMSTSELPRIPNYGVVYNISEKIKLILLGVGGLALLIGLFIYSRKANLKNRDYFIVSVVSVAVLSIFVQLPFVASSYDPIRLYQQLLILLAIFPVFGFGYFSLIHKSLNTILFTAFAIVYFVCLTHIQYYFIGGNRVQLNLANVGKDYDFSYTTADEISTVNWLLDHKPKNDIVVLDNYSQFKLYQSNRYSLEGKVKIELLPSSMDENDYVFATRTNIVQGITFKYGTGSLLIYNFPLDFLNNNKNIIYSSGNSRVYK